MKLNARKKDGKALMWGGGQECKNIVLKNK